ncbi:L-tyrosine/L-tryptophan isonitrile synthase family protein [Nonomuraea sp. NPDC049480]|uniref:L-tyrosine/L-tryptophan isonitrile synthase family protein n=1 Tax=Nonomuraea sp. NPDC049480 TaxID=3364353 RepID=UPI00378C7484
MNKAADQEKPTTGTLLSELIETDPILRLHCAVERDGVPYPDHPVHGRATRVVDPDGIQAGADVLPTSLARVFRIGLDRYGIGMDDPRFEVTPGGRATGRVVMPDVTVEELDEAAARRGLAELTDMTMLLGRTAGMPAHAVQHILETELRFLSPRAASLFDASSGEGPVHTVDARQHVVLVEVLRRVAERARLRRDDPTIKAPAVMLDIDMCALDPRARVVHALRAVGVDPNGLAALPSYHRPAWDLWIQQAAAEIDYEAFCRALFRPWENLRWDTPVPGLARFVWDVYDAGGRVVFNTGRRERVREHTEHALACAGITGPRIAFLRNDRSRPVHELKAESLQAFADLDIVAVFDDICENRQAMAKKLTDALFVAVALPGYVHERPYDGADVVRSFETVPRCARTARATRLPALSHANSLAELPLAEMSVGSPALEHAVWLSERESSDMVGTLLQGAERAAIHTAERAPRTDDLAADIYYLLTRPQFRKGARAAYSLSMARREIRPHLADGAPIPIITRGFPLKFHYNQLKTMGSLPDLSELAAMVRLRELQRTVQQVYPPGLAITVLGDGNHFRPHPRSLLRAYREKLLSYHALVGGTEILTIADLNEVAEQRMGPLAMRRHADLVPRRVAEIRDALVGLDICATPVPALEQATLRTAGVIGDNRGAGTTMPNFESLFRSLMYTVSATQGHGIAFARHVYADLFNLTDRALPAPTAAERRAVLVKAWHDTIQYMAVLWVDRDLGFDAAMFSNHIRLTPNPRSGCLGFTYLGGASVLPWHGMAALDALGRVSTDFAVSLLDQGFVPAYSTLLGPAQPWMMVPVTVTKGGRLHHGFRAAVRLRRR